MGGAGAFHHDARIYNNVFRITDVATYSINSPGVINRLYDTTPFTNIYVLNNSFYGVNTYPNLAQIRFLSGTSSNIVLQNNVWENCYFSMGHSGCIESNNGYYNNTGSGVPRGTPNQVNGTSTTFVSGGTGDFRLRDGGYAIGAALNLSNYFGTDISGYSRGSRWDIGSYQHRIAEAPSGRGNLRVQPPSGQ
jgi:hypothetical protein